MNKFKLLLSAVFLPMLLVSTAGVLFASPLDIIYDAPGNFWGKYDGSPTASDHITHAQFQFEQGIRFEHMKWVEAYVSFDWWQQTGVSTYNYWAYGVKNTTWFKPFVVGVEQENYVFNNPAVTDNTAFVGFISTNIDWNFKGR
jgi:hypothetical protein